MFELIRSNKRRSVALVGSFVLVAVVIGAVAGYLAGFGWGGMAIAFVLAGAMAFFSYWRADKIALAVSRAKPADPAQYRRLYNLVEGL